MSSALNNEENAAAAENQSGGMMVDYETLPNAIVPLAEKHFGAPFSAAEEYYALEVMIGLGLPSLSCSRVCHVGYHSR